MSRPIKNRLVDFAPGIIRFLPDGVSPSGLEEILLTVEEIEAIRLKDVEGLKQEDGAESMNVSRPTFQRILACARQKLADAIVNGKTIRIEGGNFEFAPQRFRCANGHEWDLPYQTTADGPPGECPTCKNTEIMPLHRFVKGCGKRRHTGACPLYADMHGNKVTNDNQGTNYEQYPHRMQRGQCPSKKAGHK